MSASDKIKIVFMGTPSFAATILSNLIDDASVDVVAVYTAADSVSKRGNKLQPTPVKVVAQENNIAVQTPKSLKDENAIEALRAFNPDFVCVAAYGYILPQVVLDLPKYECLNVHGSLLPKWRGAAPIQRAVLAGDKTSGVCVMRMEAGLDTGQYCKVSELDITDMSLKQIEDEFARLGSIDLIEAMKDIIAGSAQWHNQNENMANYAEKLEKRELWLNPNDKCDHAYRKVLASSSKHPSKCCLAGRNLTILSCKIADIDIPAQKGLIRFVDKHLYLGFSDGYLELIELKPDGKNKMDAVSFASGLQNIKSNKLEWSEII